MGWWERRKRRRHEGRQAKAEDARLRALTPIELAEKVAGSDLARRLPAGDTTLLAMRIAKLSDHESYLLALSAEGRTEREISQWLFMALNTVHNDLRLIRKRLSGEEGAEA
jgi:DNA-binding CsgD family transcriptional regulator